MKQILLFLAAILMSCCSSDNEIKAIDKMYITIDGQTQSMSLADNAATQALVEKLQQAPVTVTLNSSGGFEIWGALDFSLPTSDQQMTAQPGDVVLYNGSNICMFYGSNSWSYTRLGKIEGLSDNELRSFLKAGESNISVTLSLTADTTAIQQMQRTDDAEEYYTLTGQTVSSPSHGIYIKNGKKVRL